jgi:tripartite-type tricarboxylate transporter receptor subunit TctC
MESGGKLMQAVRLSVTIAAILVSAFCWTSASSAEEQYPARRIRIIVPYPAGAQTDLVARLIADGLSRKWGQVIIVDNVSGASGNLGTSMAFRSDPDGYTLLVIPPSFVTNTFVLKNSGWTVSQWSPISLLAISPYLLVAKTALDVTTVKDLITRARLKPNAISYASAGVGSSSHLTAVQLEMMSGIKMMHVPYRGAAPALNDVMAGFVDVVFDALVTTLPIWRDGKVKVLGVTSKKRTPFAPDVPTIEEAGLPDFDSSSWSLIVAPPSTPPAIVEKISASVRDVLKEPAVVQRLRSLSLDVGGTTPAETAAFLARETARWEKVVNSAGISVE